MFCGATLHFGRWVSVPHLAELIRGPTRVVHRVPGGEGGGVSGPTQDLRLVTEVEAGVNFRSAGLGRGGRLLRSFPDGGGGAVTPSFHPEVADVQFVSPGRGVDIRQSKGWERVCGTARSGIWVLKGDARGRKLPANLDHLSVQWRKWRSYDTAWVTPNHDVLCSYACVDMEQQWLHLGWSSWFVEQGRTHFVSVVCKRRGANGSELEPVRGFRIMYPLAQR